MHHSKPVGNCEFINVVPLNPLISKCQIKVCYVSELPNRNGSIITKDVAMKMANSLPGSPIVGYYNKEEKDFESHNEELVIGEDDIYWESTTVPYGFIDLNAKVWFQKFIDDGHIEREYLVTEGYLWTGRYPEVNRVMIHGNNHSMELDKINTRGTWTKDENGNPQFFKINETNVSALCILGENVEPCFEGAQFKSEFSLNEKFLNTFYTMVQELKEILSEGGNPMEQEMTTINEVVEEVTTEEVIEETVVEEVVEEVATEETVVEETENFSENQGQTSETEDVEISEDNEGIVENESIEEGVVEESAPEATGTKEYSLDDIPEYTELSNNYSALQEDYNELQTRFSALEDEVNTLRTFKANTERVEKTNLIGQFYMLSDEDKREYLDNIDKYSLSEIEEKLSVVCFRNKVSFATSEDKQETQDVLTYNLSVEEELDDTPAWVKAVRATKEEK